MSAATEPKRILIATIGSLGDLHPCLALGLELRKRGHQITIASTPFYREKIEALGLAFHGVRPDWDPGDTELIRQCEDLKRGPEILFRKLILPHVRETYEDLIAAAANADFIVAGEIVYPVPLIAEKLQLRWASVILSPASFLSSEDPPLLVNVPWLIHVRKAGVPAHRAVLNLGRMGVRHWWKPVRELRREVGLNPRCDPVFADKFSPYLVLALFSRVLGAPQPDWPRQTMQPGFVYFDEPEFAMPGLGMQGPGIAMRQEALTELEAFLESGDAPIVFTLGSTAVHNPGNFFATSAEAARQLGRRAVLLGAAAEAGDAAAGILAVPYAPYSRVFGKAAAVVHQGGSGTTAQALRAGRPMLIVPYGWDQPDNGARVQRMGAGLTVARANYSPRSAGAALRRILTEERFARRAMEAATVIQSESGVGGACEAIESVMRLASK